MSRFDPTLRKILLVAVVFLGLISSRLFVGAALSLGQLTTLQHACTVTLAVLHNGRHGLFVTNSRKSEAWLITEGDGWLRRPVLVFQVPPNKPNGAPQ